MQKTVLKYLGNERRHGFLKIDFSKMTFGQKIALKSTNFQKSKKNFQNSYEFANLPI